MTDTAVIEDTTDPTPPPSSVSRPHAAAAGLAGAGVALAVGELLAGLSRRVASLVIAVADVVIRQADAETAGAAIEVFGTTNKPVLITGIVVITLAVGAATAAASIRRPAILGTVYAVFGLAGAWAAVRSPLHSDGLSVVVAALAALAGWLTTRWLLAVAAAALAAESLLEEPAGRRRFIVSFSSVAALAAMGAAVGRRLRSANTVEAQRAEVAEQLATVIEPPPTEVMAVEQSVAEVEGISPYVTPTEDFYRIDIAAEIPQIDPADWSLRIDGLVDQPLEFTLDDLRAEELGERTVTISCVSNPIGGRYAGNARWTGVPLESLLDRAGVHDDADQIIGRSFTGWTGGFPRSVVGDGRTALVAVGMNGEPLPTRHGFPARLIVAGLYGYVSATKWLSNIELTRWDAFDGYWIDRGWAKEGPVKVTSRIDVPKGGLRVPSGTVALGGVAWAPTRGISAVEIRIDDADEWIPAQLGDTVSDETWVQWSAALQLTPGTYSIDVRAYDGDGQPQHAGPKSVFPDGAEGYHRVRFQTI